MKTRSLLRAAIALSIATAPILTACELVLDFDRSPLQPIYEAGPVDDTVDSGGGGTDAPVDRGSTPETGGDAPSGNDSGNDSGVKDATADG